MSAVETVTFNKIILDTHRLSKQPLCINQDDTKGLYDRIIRSLVLLKNRKFRTPENVYKLHSVTNKRKHIEWKLR